MLCFSLAPFAWPARIALDRHVDRGVSLKQYFLVDRWLDNMMKVDFSSRLPLACSLGSLLLSFIQPRDRWHRWESMPGVSLRWAHYGPSLLSLKLTVGLGGSQNGSFGGFCFICVQLHGTRSGVTYHEKKLASSLYTGTTIGGREIVIISSKPKDASSCGRLSAGYRPAKALRQEQAGSTP